jgi:hypothetical protein
MKIPSPFRTPGACSTFGWLNFIPDCNQGFESEIIDAKEGTRKKKKFGSYGSGFTGQELKSQRI